MAPGLRAPRCRAGLHRGRGGRGGEEEVEAKPEEEEGVQLRGKAAATTKQLRGGLVFIPDHSVTVTPPRRHPAVCPDEQNIKKTQTLKKCIRCVAAFRAFVHQMHFPPQHCAIKISNHRIGF